MATSNKSRRNAWYIEHQGAGKSQEVCFPSQLLASPHRRGLSQVHLGDRMVRLGGRHAERVETTTSHHVLSLIICHRCAASPSCEIAIRFSARFVNNDNEMDAVKEKNLLLNAMFTIISTVKLGKTSLTSPLRTASQEARCVWYWKTRPTIRPGQTRSLVADEYAQLHVKILRHYMHWYHIF